MTDLYTSQRTMRNMRRAAMQRGVIAILDVGTSKIACLILRHKNLLSQSCCYYLVAVKQG